MSFPRLRKEEQNGVHPCVGAWLLLQTRLGEDASNVSLNCPRLDKQLFGDGRIISATCHAGENLSFTLCHFRQEPAFSGLPASGEFVDDVWGDDGLALGHILHGLNKVSETG